MSLDRSWCITRTAAALIALGKMANGQLDPLLLHSEPPPTHNPALVTPSQCAGGRRRTIKMIFGCLIITELTWAVVAAVQPHNDWRRLPLHLRPLYICLSLSLSLSHLLLAGVKKSH